MNYHSYYADAERPVETCVVGTGGFGQSFLAQAQRVPLMNARIAVDLTAEAAAAGLKAAGIDPRRIRICTNPRAGRKGGMGCGRLDRRQRSRARRRAPLRCRRRGDRPPGAAARHALLAIEADKHLALVTKEADSVIGPGAEGPRCR